MPAASRSTRTARRGCASDFSAAFGAATCPAGTAASPLRRLGIVATPRVRSFSGDLPASGPVSASDPMSASRVRPPRPRPASARRARVGGAVPMRMSAPMRVARFGVFTPPAAAAPTRSATPPPAGFSSPPARLRARPGASASTPPAGDCTEAALADGSSVETLPAEAPPLPPSPASPPSSVAASADAPSSPPPPPDAPPLPAAPSAVASAETPPDPLEPSVSSSWPPACVPVVASPSPSVAPASSARADARNVPAPRWHDEPWRHSRQESRQHPEG